MDDSTALNGTKLLRGHAQKLLIVRKEFAGNSENQGKKTGQNQAEAQEQEQGTPTIKTGGLHPGMTAKKGQGTTVIL
jgi:hypothetical protein